MANNFIFNGLEAGIGPALARDITRSENGIVEVEEHGVIFAFNIRVRTKRETETTGVEHNGERETFVKVTYTADVEYIGACDWDGEDVEPDIDFGLLAHHIEEQNSISEVIRASVK